MKVQSLSGAGINFPQEQTVKYKHSKAKIQNNSKL